MAIFLQHLSPDLKRLLYKTTSFAFLFSLQPVDRAKPVHFHITVLVFPQINMMRVRSDCGTGQSLRSKQRMRDPRKTTTSVHCPLVRVLITFTTCNHSLRKLTTAHAGSRVITPATRRSLHVVLTTTRKPSLPHALDLCESEYCWSLSLAPCTPVLVLEIKALFGFACVVRIKCRGTCACEPHCT